MRKLDYNHHFFFYQNSLRCDKLPKREEKSPPAIYMYKISLVCHTKIVIFTFNSFIVTVNKIGRWGVVNLSVHLPSSHLQPLITVNEPQKFFHHFDSTDNHRGNVLWPFSELSIHLIFFLSKRETLACSPYPFWLTRILRCVLNASTCVKAC